MPLSLGSLLRTPSDLASAARAVLGWTDEAVQLVADLPGRVAALVDEVEQLVVRVNATVDRVEGVVDRVEGVCESADVVVGQIVTITGAAEAVLESVGATSARAEALLQVVTPIAERGAPLAQRFVDEFSEEEVAALIRLIDQVPVFTQHMEDDIMPILTTLDRVGPDIHELLEVTKDLRLAIQGMPGLRFLSRRGSDRDED